MSEQTTQIPSISSRLVEMLTGGEAGTESASKMAEAVLSIGAVLTAAGVAWDVAAGAAQELGSLSVDPKLPSIAAAASVNNSRGRS